MRRDSVREYDLMKKYFPMGINWLNGNDFPGGPSIYPHSLGFDFDSIMIYDSSAAALPGTYVLTRRTSDTQWGTEIHGGGTPLYKFKAVSWGDIQRIAQLYPLAPSAPAVGSLFAIDTAVGGVEGGLGGDMAIKAGQEGAHNLSTKVGPATKQWKPVKVSIPGYGERIIRPPPP